MIFSKQGAPLVLPKRHDLPNLVLNENMPINERLLLGNCSHLASDADSSDRDHNRIYYQLLS